MGNVVSVCGDRPADRPSALEPLSVLKLQPAAPAIKIPPLAVGRTSGRRHLSRMLGAIQRSAFSYFLHETNPGNGLVLDKTYADWPASIAAVGLGLTSYPVG